MEGVEINNIGETNPKYFDRREFVGFIVFILYISKFLWHIWKTNCGQNHFHHNMVSPVRGVEMNLST